MPVDPALIENDPMPPQPRARPHAEHKLDDLLDGYRRYSRDGATEPSYSRPRSHNDDIEF